MNQLKLSLRAADDPRTIKEENGVPTFASVFSLHNTTRKGREETVPITVKASHELAQTLVNELKKGVASSWKDSLPTTRVPKRTGRPIRSGPTIHRHHPAKIHRGESQLIS